MSELIILVSIIEFIIFIALSYFFIKSAKKKGQQHFESRQNFRSVSLIFAFIWVVMLYFLPKTSFGMLTLGSQLTLSLICEIYSANVFAYVYTRYNSFIRAAVFAGLAYIPVVAIIPFLWLSISKKGLNSTEKL